MGHHHRRRDDTRGVSLDLDLARKLQITPACNGYQSPFFIARADALRRRLQSHLRHAGRPEPVPRRDPGTCRVDASRSRPPGGSSIAVTLACPGGRKARSLEEQYVVAGFNLSGIANVTDSPESGVASVRL